MADSDKTLKLLIELGVIGQEDAKAAGQLMDEMKQGQTALAKEMDVVTVSQGDVEKALTKGGESAVGAREKYKLLHHAFGELNKIVPGLGTILNVFERGLDRMGEAGPKAAAGLATVGGGAEAAGAGCAAAESAVDSLIVTLGPLIIIMEAVQLTTELWDIHTEKVKVAAAAQAEAYKQIEDASKKAFTAQQELNDALHPKPDAVKGLEKELHDKERDINNQADRQKAINKAEEERQLAGATTPEQKEAIKKKFKSQNDDEDEMAEHARIGAQRQVASEAEWKLKQKQDKSDADKKAAGQAMREATDEETAAQKQYDQGMREAAQEETAAPYQYAQAPISEKDQKRLDAAKKKSADAAALVKKLDEESAELDKDSTELVKFRDKTNDSAGEDATNFNYRRGTRQQVESVDRRAGAEQSIRDYAPKGFDADGQQVHLQTLQQLEQATGKTEAQKAAILQQIISHQITAQWAWAQMAQQVAELEQQVKNSRNNTSG